MEPVAFLHFPERGTTLPLHCDSNRWGRHKVTAPTMAAPASPPLRNPWQPFPLP